MSVTFQLTIKDGRTFKAWRMLNSVRGQVISEYIGIDKTYLSKIENNACPFLPNIYEKYLEFVNSTNMTDA